jgi:hypothetical protein
VTGYGPIRTTLAEFQFDPDAGDAWPEPATLDDHATDGECEAQVPAPSDGSPNDYRTALTTRP